MVWSQELLGRAFSLCVLAARLTASVVSSADGDARGEVCGLSEAGQSDGVAQTEALLSAIEVERLAGKLCGNAEWRSEFQVGLVGVALKRPSRGGSSACCLMLRKVSLWLPSFRVFPEGGVPLTTSVALVLNDAPTLLLCALFGSRLEASASMDEEKAARERRCSAKAAQVLSAFLRPDEKARFEQVGNTRFTFQRLVEELAVRDSLSRRRWMHACMQAREAMGRVVTRAAPIESWFPALFVVSAEEPYDASSSDLCFERLACGSLCSRERGRLSVFGFLSAFRVTRTGAALGAPRTLRALRVLCRRTPLPTPPPCEERGFAGAWPLGVARTSGVFFGCLRTCCAQGTLRLLVCWWEFREFCSMDSHRGTGASQGASPQR